MRGQENARDEAQRLIEAAAWRLHLTEIDAETTPEFQAWVADPANADAWSRVDAPWSFIKNQSAEPASVNVRLAALQNAKSARSQQERIRALPRVARFLAAASLVLALCGGGLWWFSQPDDYATGAHERRVIALADGSRVSLDSNSEVTVRYSRQGRELQLLRGQARFDVAHDVQRPFSVSAGDQKVIATGTAFNVDIAGPSILVTLIEGHVIVLNQDDNSEGTLAKAPATPKPAGVELHAGQQLAALPQELPEVAPANIERVTAWTNGQLMFDNEALSAVVARVNQYTDTPVVIDDPKIARMRISGVFNTGDLRSFIDIVTQFLPLKAVQSDSGSITLEEKK